MTTSHTDDVSLETRLLQWGGGIVVPLLLGGWGLYFLVRRVAVIPTGKGSMVYMVTLTGFDAVAVGVCILAVTLYCHFHCYWATQPHCELYGERAKTLSLLLLALSFAYVTFAVIRFFVLS